MWTPLANQKTVYWEVVECVARATNHNEMDSSVVTELQRA